MTDYEKATIMVFLRKSRFVENYDANEEIFSLVTKFFSDKKLLDKHGIEHFYNGAIHSGENWCYSHNQYETVEIK